jgi:hypothetical protein
VVNVRNVPAAHYVPRGEVFVDLPWKEVDVHRVRPTVLAEQHDQLVLAPAGALLAEAEDSLGHRYEHVLLVDGGTTP